MNYSLLDGVPRQYQIGFQSPASPAMEAIIALHNHVMFYLTIVLVFTFAALAYILITFTLPKACESRFFNYHYYGLTKKAHITHHALLEFIWTLLPAVILAVIALPSFTLLYAVDSVTAANFIYLKVTGHQWYWSYEYSWNVWTWKGFLGGASAPKKSSINADLLLTVFPPEMDKISFDSYMIPTEELKKSQIRLLSTNNVVMLPVGKYIRVEVTASDVLHSWAVPALGVKMDAVPGRLNEITLYISKVGQFYGQCSELCGVNHGFMPIHIISLPVHLFLTWAHLVGDKYTAIAAKGFYCRSEFDEIFWSSKLVKQPWKFFKTKDDLIFYVADRYMKKYGYHTDRITDDSLVNVFDWCSHTYAENRTRGHLRKWKFFFKKNVHGFAMKHLVNWTSIYQSNHK